MAGGSKSMQAFATSENAGELPGSSAPEKENVSN
jgi:hypothetical protein